MKADSVMGVVQDGEDKSAIHWGVPAHTSVSADAQAALATGTIRHPVDYDDTAWPTFAADQWPRRERERPGLVASRWGARNPVDGSWHR